MSCITGPFFGNPKWLSFTFGLTLAVTPLPTHAQAPAPCRQGPTAAFSNEGWFLFVPPSTVKIDKKTSVSIAGIISEYLAEADLQQQREQAIKEFLQTPSLKIYRTSTAQPDRYGRNPAILEAPESAYRTSLQETLLSRGLARVSTSSLAVQCEEHLLQLEQRTREQNLGIWQQPEYAIKKAARLDLPTIVSTYQIIEGTVLAVERNPDGTSYLNFGKKWSEDFTVTLSKKHLQLWEEKNKRLDDLLHKPIYVRGWVENKAGALIRVTDPLQLRLKNEN